MPRLNGLQSLHSRRRLWFLSVCRLQTSPELQASGGGTCEALIALAFLLNLLLPRADPEAGAPRPCTVPLCHLLTETRGRGGGGGESTPQGPGEKLKIQISPGETRSVIQAFGETRVPRQLEGNKPRRTRVTPGMSPARSGQDRSTREGRAGAEEQRPPTPCVAPETRQGQPRLRGTWLKGPE